MRSPAGRERTLHRTSSAGRMALGPRGSLLLRPEPALSGVGACPAPLWAARGLPTDTRNQCQASRRYSGPTMLTLRQDEFNARRTKGRSVTQLPLAEHDQSSIVMLGSFNPRIFQPSWFVRHELLPPEAESETDINLISNDLAVFQTDWCRLEVMNERFAVHSLAAPVVESLRDLIKGTFEVLRHTPISRAGLNTAAHFTLPNEEAWHKFGHAIAPKADFWDPVLQNPGTLTLTVQAQRPDDYGGHINVKVEPSSRVRYGLFVETNEEFHAPAGTDDATWISSLLSEAWDPAQKRARDIRTHILEQALRIVG